MWVFGPKGRTDECSLFSNVVVGKLSMSGAVASLSSHTLHSLASAQVFNRADVDECRV